MNVKRSLVPRGLDSDNTMLPPSVSRANLPRHMNNFSFPAVISKTTCRVGRRASPCLHSTAVTSLSKASWIAPRFNSAAHPHYLSVFKSLRLLSQLSHQLPPEAIGWTFCVWYLEKKRRQLDCRAKVRRLGTCAMNSEASTSWISWISHHPGRPEWSCNPQEPQLSSPETTS